MSYCGPVWMSKFTHDYMTNIAQLTPVVVPSGAAAAPRVIEHATAGFEPDADTIAPFIHLMGTIGVDGVVEVVSVARIDTRYLREGAVQTAYVAQHLDADGRILAEDVLYVHADSGCCGDDDEPGKGCGCQDEPRAVTFKAMLRDTAPGACLRIVKRGEVVWERKAGEKPARLGGVKATLTKAGDLELSWKHDAADKEYAKEHKEHAEVWVRWTADDGRTWHALTTGLRGGSATIPADQLPSGSVRFELLAHDGFHTARATTDVVSIPARPPAVSILYPAAGERVYGDRFMHLWGRATSYGGGAIADDAFEWSIDGTPVARGSDLWVSTPGPRTARAAPGGAGDELTGEATATFDVAGAEPAPIG